MADASDLDIDEAERLLVATRASFGGRALAAVTCPKAPITMPIEAMISGRLESVAAKYRNGASTAVDSRIAIGSRLR